MLSNLNDVFVGGTNYKDKVFNKFEDILKEDILLQKYPSVSRNNFNVFLKEKGFMCNPKMEVASHRLLVELALNNFGIALLTKEFLSNELNKSLFEIKSSVKIPERKLGYAIKKNIVISFATSKFIDILDCKK